MAADPLPHHVMCAFAATAEVHLWARRHWGASHAEDDLFAWVEELRPVLVRATELAVRGPEPTTHVYPATRRPRRR